MYPENSAILRSSINIITVQNRCNMHARAVNESYQVVATKLQDETDPLLLSATQELRYLRILCRREQKVREGATVRYEI